MRRCWRTSADPGKIRQWFQRAFLSGIGMNKCESDEQTRQNRKTEHKKKPV
jgi:hypothetical protein